MKLWKWKAVDERGKMQSGLIYCRGEDMAINRLRSRNLYPLFLRAAVFSSLWLRAGNRRGQKYWARIARQIGTLLDAGLPMLTILEILQTRETNSFRQNQWLVVYNQVKAGYDLSSALKEFIPSPGPFVQAMITAGERSGTLAFSLLEVADQLEEEYYFSRKIKGVLFYPCLLLILALTVLFTLSSIVFPMYNELFQQTNAQLPILTRGLMHFGSSIPYLLLIIIFFGSITMFKNRKKMVWTMPGMQQIMKGKALQQFCTLFAKFINAGIPLLECLMLLESIVWRQELIQLLDQMKTAVREGRRITPVLENSSFFPPVGAKMLGIAEESGRLSEMLNYLAKVFKQELEEKLEQYPRVLEQLLVIGMAGLIGLVAVGMLLPVFDLSTHIP
ncbi:MAG: type II secretion system F family protein [Peptococcaceae bacterium]|nr:type II secretion system F family protein [Peptococcaceae bacterium]